MGSISPARATARRSWARRPSRRSLRACAATGETERGLPVQAGRLTRPAAPIRDPVTSAAARARAGGRVVGIAIGVLVDAATAAGVEAVDDRGREHDEEETEDECAACEFHAATVRLAPYAVCEGGHRGRASSTGNRCRRRGRRARRA